MKKARRKFLLALTCLLTFLFTAPLLVSAEGETMRAPCTHPTLRTESTTEYITQDGTYHQRRTVRKKICTVCNTEQSREYGAYSSEPHNHYHAVGDGYHKGSQHIWYYRCVQCHHSYSVSLECNGPPCYESYSLDALAADILTPCEHSATSKYTVRVPVPEISDTAYYFATTTSCENCGAALSTTQGPLREPRPRTK